MTGRSILGALVRSLLRLGLCPKMKYPAFYAGIIIVSGKQGDGALALFVISTGA